MKDWIMELCPEIAEWQADMIAEECEKRVKAAEAALTEKQEPIDSNEKAGAYMDARLWEFVDMAASWPKAKPDSRIWGHVMVYAPAPEAKQEPYDKTEMNAFVQNLYDQKMREGKHGHYETMFHVVHQAIKRAHPAPVAKQEPSGWLDEQTGDYSRVNRLGWSALYLHPAPEAKQEALLDSTVPPHALYYPLSDYHRAPAEGPLNFTWIDKPHRLLYDLIAAVKFYANPAPSVNAKTLTNEQIDELWRKSCSLEGFSTAQFVRHFARAAIAAAEGKV